MAPKRPHFGAPQQRKGTIIRSPLAFDVVEEVRTTIPAVCSEGVPSMCDYSLHLLTSRPATVGDKLVTTKFANSITRGFATVEQPTVAVCLLPGTEVAFGKDIIEYRHTLLPNRKIREKVARFRQV